MVDRTSGTHVDNIVVAKRNRIKRLFNGDLSPINTIYHENTHMTQEDRLEKLPTNYKEYMMQKERVIREVSPKYYNENYTMMYIEIEARERAAQKTAKYIGKNLLPSSVIKKCALEGLSNSPAFFRYVIAHPILFMYVGSCCEGNFSSSCS